MLKIYDCKTFVEEWKDDIHLQMNRLSYAPVLGIGVLGDISGTPSEVYVNNKLKVAAELGVNARVYNYTEETLKSTRLVDICDRIREDSKNVDAYILQSPARLNDYITINMVRNAIWHETDVDCMTDKNRGALYSGGANYPATVHGIRYLLLSEFGSLKGKRALVIGRSDIVGRPAAAMLEHENCTVTLAHSHTSPEELEALCSSVDIIISAVGKPGLIKPHMVRGYGTFVVDVGISRDENGKLIGDCGDISEWEAYFNYEGGPNHPVIVTPVPGGVGLITTTALMHRTVENTLNLYFKW